MSFIDEGFAFINASILAFYFPLATFVQLKRFFSPFSALI